MSTSSRAGVHDGQSRTWRLANTRREAIWATVPEETEDNLDDVTWALAEADWAGMDEVVEHWRPTADALMAKLIGKRARPQIRPTPHSRTKPLRSPQKRRGGAPERGGVRREAGPADAEAARDWEERRRAEGGVSYAVVSVDGGAHQTAVGQLPAPEIAVLDVVNEPLGMMNRRGDVATTEVSECQASAGAVPRQGASQRLPATRSDGAARRRRKEHGQERSPDQPPRQ